MGGAHSSVSCSRTLGWRDSNLQLACTFTRPPVYILEESRNGRTRIQLNLLQKHHRQVSPFLFLCFYDNYVTKSTCTCKSVKLNVSSPLCHNILCQAFFGVVFFYPLKVFHFAGFCVTLGDLNEVLSLCVVSRLNTHHAFTLTHTDTDTDAAGRRMAAIKGQLHGVFFVFGPISTVI